MKMLMKKGRLNQIKISANVIAPVKKKSCYKEVMVPTKARTIYRSRLLNTIQAIIISAFLLIYPLTACAGETNNPKGEDKYVFPLNNVEWKETSNPYWWNEGVHFTMDTITYYLRQISENKSELYRQVKKATGMYVKNPETGTGKFVPDSAWAVEQPLLDGWITLVDKKVYYEPSWLGEPTEQIVLLYDFDLNIGDTFYVAPQVDNGKSHPYIVISIDNILVDSEYKKRFNFVEPHMQNDYEFYKFSLIESIGCDIELFHTFVPRFLYNDMDPMPPYYTLLAVYNRDKLIWNLLDYLLQKPMGE